MLDADTIEEAERGGHSVFAPSASAMWLACPGSLIPHVSAPDTAGFDAAQGTIAHAIAADWFRQGEPHHLMNTNIYQEAGSEIHEIHVDGSMLSYLRSYVRWCDELPGTHMVEQRVALGDYFPIPNQGGTADHIALLPMHLTITDLKYGYVQVFAKDNSQIMLYALGVFLEWDWLYNFQKITLRICQPRLEHFDVFEISRDELLAFGEKVRERAALCLEPDAPRLPTAKGCRWCNVRGTCPALAGTLERLADDTFHYEQTSRDMVTTMQSLETGRPVPEAPNPLKLETEHLARILAYRELFETWFREIFEELRRRANDGQEIKGWKMVPGRNSRSWQGPQAVWRLARLAKVPLDRLLAPPEPLSPHQAGIALRAEGFKPAEIERMMNNLVLVTPGPRTLAPEGDTRGALLPIADETFRYAEAGADDV